MKKISVRLLAIFCLCAAALAHAGEFASLQQKLIDARYAIWIMLDSGDRRSPEQILHVRDAYDAVSDMIKTMKIPRGKRPEFKELVDTWKSFKKTTEEVLVPLILSKGKQKEAEHLAMGIQNERLALMLDLCEELDQPDGQSARHFFENRRQAADLQAKRELTEACDIGLKLIAKKPENTELASEELMNAGLMQMPEVELMLIDGRKETFSMSAKHRKGTMLFVTDKQCFLTEAKKTDR